MDQQKDERTNERKKEEKSTERGMNGSEDCVLVLGTTGRIHVGKVGLVLYGDFYQFLK